MREYKNTFIHEKGLTLSRHERQWLNDMAGAEQQEILGIFKLYPNHKFPIHQLEQLTTIPKDHIKRCVTNLAQTDPEKPNEMDEWGRPRLNKLGDEHKVARRTQSDRTVHVHTWTLNEEWGTEPRRLQEDPPREEDGQGVLFERESRGPKQYSGTGA